MCERPQLISVNIGAWLLVRALRTCILARGARDDLNELRCERNSGPMQWTLLEVKRLAPLAGGTTRPRCVGQRRSVLLTMSTEGDSAVDRHPTTSNRG